MMEAAFVATTGLLFALFLLRSLRHEKQSGEVLAEARASGLAEPPSLHPLIDDDLCIGCGACVDACPEERVLGMVDGRARLVGASHCIGHGACKTACPTDAIELVFGTERRGLDIPFVKEDFETNVPGIFIAGELGGMGLIRNAFEQGRQAVEAIRKLEGIGGDPNMLDLVIVGAGPAGFSASLASKEHGLRFVTLEQETLGGTIAHYPRGKLVMTRPGRLSLVGKFRFTETTKERLLEFLSEAEKKTGLEIKYRERVEAIQPNGRGFLVRGTGSTYHTRAVLLAIGRRGTPRKLGVEGEDLDKVTYRLLEPEQFRSRRVLVVGGGDSALEAATQIAEQPGAHVTISYRSAAFSRAKPQNVERLERARTAGRVNVILPSTVRAIHPESVELEQEGRPVKLRNDAVIVCAGGILPTPFLKQIGIEVETKRGTA